MYAYTQIYATELSKHSVECPDSGHGPAASGVDAVIATMWSISFLHRYSPANK